MFQTVGFIQMMSLTFGLFTQVSGSGPLGPLVSRRAVVSYWRKYVHEVLVNRLGGLSLPRESVVRLTDRPDMRLSLKFCLFAVLRPTRQNRRDPNFFFAISDF